MAHRLAHLVSFWAATNLGLPPYLHAAQPKHQLMPDTNQDQTIWLDVHAGVSPQDTTLRLELADTQRTRARGLMHRRALGPRQGMLFAFADSMPRSFWMHDTPLPLDMIFLSAKRKVVHIIHRAQPLTDVPRSCTIPSQFVIELLGGQAMATGIGQGDILRFALPRVPAP